ncbi:sensor histidine kinase [Paenibacillus sp. p3-SID867]|uniref:sensor histidine kinase n=1 Tax=Paenibacillus sp. p3-SID867 TaxID=2916363 RepID=UPI0037C52873
MDRLLDFLAFSKDVGTDEPQDICTLGEIIESVLELLSPRLIDENIEIKLLLHCNNLLVIQKVSVQQVLTNILINSIDALSSNKNSKVIEIHTYDDNMNCYIDVIDNGLGIPPNIQNTIFTPFVTSKSNGTGLGLAISKEIMKKNQGDICFTSQIGETKFTLSFKKEI